VNTGPQQLIDLLPDATRLHLVMKFDDGSPLIEMSVRGAELLEVKVPDFVPPPNVPFNRQVRVDRPRGPVSASSA
jgi:hypothetical protein